MNRRGGSPLLMVLMLLLSGIVLLHGNARLLERGMAGIADETQFLQDFYQAQSSLQWGLSRQWPAAKHWQCQSEAEQGWQSCLLWQTAELGILRGQSANGEKILWRWIHPAEPASQTVVARRGGWTDLCPLPEDAECFAQPTGL